MPDRAVVAPCGICVTRPRHRHHLPRL